MEDRTAARIEMALRQIANDEDNEAIRDLILTESSGLSRTVIALKNDAMWLDFLSV